LLFEVNELIFYLSTPLSEVEDRIDTVKELGFYPEIRMTRTDFLFNMSDRRLEVLRKKIEGYRLETFTHGPFFGLDIASLDAGISRYSRDCLLRGLDVTAALGGNVMVIHTGYLPYFSRGGRRHWFRNWRARMPAVAEAAEKRGVRIALENSWDDRPEIMIRLAESLPGYDIRYCIDTGHVNRYSRLPIGQWWDALGGKVEVLHLHDNDGLSDDHLAPGEGSFDFDGLAGILRGESAIPRLDLEVSYGAAERSREYLKGVFGRSGQD